MMEIIVELEKSCGMKKYIQSSSNEIKRKILVTAEFANELKSNPERDRKKREKADED